jgi:hypothetical protein
MQQVDEQWLKERVQSGVTSGEGLVLAVRDPVVKQVAEREGDETRSREAEVDPGVSKKRLLAMGARL